MVKDEAAAAADAHILGGSRNVPDISSKNEETTSNGVDPDGFDAFLSFAFLDAPLRRATETSLSDDDIENDYHDMKMDGGSAAIAEEAQPQEHHQEACKDTRSRAETKSKRGRDERLRKSEEAPELESARFFGGDALDDDDDNSKGEAAGRPELDEERIATDSAAGVQSIEEATVSRSLGQENSDVMDEKASARAKRKTEREERLRRSMERMRQSVAKLRHSVETPHKLGLGDTESVQLFGSDPATIDLDASSSDHSQRHVTDASVGIDGQQKQGKDNMETLEKDSSVVSTDKKATVAATGNGGSDIKMNKQKSAGFIDLKAEARAKRKALRDAKSSKSTQAPRMFGYEDSESARFFGGDPSSRILAASPDDDIEGKGEEESDLDVNKTEPELQPTEGGREQGEAKQEINAMVDGYADGFKMNKQKSAGFIDPKAEARAKRKALRDARLSKSIEAPRMFGYEDSESSRFFSGPPSTRDLGASPSDDDADVHGQGGKKADLEVDKEPQEDKNSTTPHNSGGKHSVNKEKKTLSQGRPETQNTDSHINGGGDTCDLDVSDASLGPDDLQRPTAIHSNHRQPSAEDVHSKDSAVDSNHAIDRLRPSLSSHFGHSMHSVESVVSDISLGIDDLEEEEKEQDSPVIGSLSMPVVSKRMTNTETLHHSMIPRRRSARTEDALRRSNSSGADIGQNSTDRLKLLHIETKKRPTAHRMRRTRVARLNDGKLDASVNASMTVLPSAITGLTGLTNSDRSAPAANNPPSQSVSRQAKRGGHPLMNSLTSGTIASNAWSKGNRRASVDNPHTAPSKGNRRATTDNLSSYTGSESFARLINEKRERVTKRQSSSASESTSVTIRTSNEGGAVKKRHITFGGVQQLDDSEHSRVSVNESDYSGNSGARSHALLHGETPIDEEEQAAFHSKLYHHWGNFIGWTPFRRYRRRSAASIAMMDNQFFIPPPEEGATFFESLYYTMNGYGNDFVVWIYQAGFFTVLVLFFLAYYALVFAFAGILVAMESRTGGRCGLDVYEAWSKSHAYYELAFELSWTTFTTVGYGLVSPSGDPNDDDCYGMRFACSLFAFMGLLFNSLSAAIFFSKLERVLTRASVTFSSSACLEFGKAASYTRGSKGVYGQFWMKNSSMRSLASIDTESNKSNRSLSSVGSAARNRGLVAIHESGRAFHSVPFPFLEFRIVNDHANYENRAVRNAAVTAMVQLNAKDAESLIERGLSKRSSSAGTFREYVTIAPSSHSNSRDSSKDSQSPTSITANTENNSIRGGSSNHRERRNLLSVSASMTAKAIVVQESDSGTHKGSGPEGRVYYPLTLEPNEHPYFRRVWYIRHTLNAKSPLLKKEVREKIKNDGGWDPSRNCYQDILSSLVDFHRIRITFKGTSAVSNALVFAQKVYTIEDIYVGWQFGQIFHEKERWRWFRNLLGRPKMKEENGEEDSIDDDNLKLDKRLIHDIIPQPGGGQEPIEG